MIQLPHKANIALSTKFKLLSVTDAFIEEVYNTRECRNSVFERLMYLVDLLWNIYDGDEHKIMSYMETSSEVWPRIAPCELLELGKVKGLVDYLETVYQGSEGLGS